MYVRFIVPASLAYAAHDALRDEHEEFYGTPPGYDRLFCDGTGVLLPERVKENALVHQMVGTDLYQPNEAINCGLREYRVPADKWNCGALLEFCWITSAGNVLLFRRSDAYAAEEVHWIVEYRGRRHALHDTGCGVGIAMQAMSAALRRRTQAPRTWAEVEVMSLESAAQLPWYLTMTCCGNAMEVSNV